MKNKKDMSYNNIDIGEVIAGIILGGGVLAMIFYFIKGVLNA